MAEIKEECGVFGIYDLDVNQLRLPISHKLVPLAVTAVAGIKI